MKLVIDDIFASDGINSQVRIRDDCFRCIFRNSLTPVPQISKGITTDGYYLSEIQFENATVMQKSRMETDSTGKRKTKSLFFLPKEVADKLLVVRPKVENPYDMSKFQPVVTIAA